MPDEPETLIPPLADALSRLEPASGLNRDRLMFAAGAESRRSTIRLWQAAAGFLAAIGFAIGVLVYSNTTSPFNPPPAKTSPTSR